MSETALRLQLCDHDRCTTAGLTPTTYRPLSPSDLVFFPMPVFTHTANCLMTLTSPSYNRL